MGAKDVVGIVPAAWHMPFHVNHGVPFRNHVLAMIDKVQIPKVSEPLIRNLESLDPSTFRGSWSISSTKRIIQIAYEGLLALGALVDGDDEKCKDQDNGDDDDDGGNAAAGGLSEASPLQLPAGMKECPACSGTSPPPLCIVIVT
eukprot:1922624-Rhodomonas_salina.1